MEGPQSDPEAILLALMAVMEKELQCIKKEIQRIEEEEMRRIKMLCRLTEIVEPFFNEVKQKYPDTLLHSHTHPEDDRDSCEFVKDYGLCFPEVVRDAVKHLGEYYTNEVVDGWSDALKKYQNSVELLENGHLKASFC